MLNMSKMARRVGWAAAVAAVALYLAGCGGNGWELPKDNRTPIGDNPPADGGDGDDGNGGTPPGGQISFRGEWVTSYGDDRAEQNARPQQYAVRLNLQQSGGNLSGTGVLFRVIREVAGQNTDAIRRIPITASGTANGADATLEINATNATLFPQRPFWHLRISNTQTQLVGMYQETDGGGKLTRSGHAEWHKVVTGNLAGTTWASAFSDRHAAEGLPRLDRAALLTIGLSGTQLTGEGNFLAPLDSGAVQTQEFLLTRGAVQGSEFGVTFGGGDLSAFEMDWAGFFTNSRVVGAYGQFNAQSELVRFGHATYHRVSTNPGASEIARTWVGAWEDSGTASGVRPYAYVGVMTLNVGESGQLTGTALVFDQGSGRTTPLQYNIENGQVRGARLTFQMGSISQRFEWEMHVAGARLAGAYRAVNSSGQYRSRGAAEFRPSQQPVLSGVYVASFHDTFGRLAPAQTQYAVMRFAPGNGSSVSGTGSVRFAGEEQRRLFSMNGSVDSGVIHLTWEGGGGLQGGTKWQLRQASNALVGVYENQTSEGTLESHGYAVFTRAAENPSS